MEELKRVCKKCGVEKKHSDFAKHKQCKFGITHECRACSLLRAQYKTPEKLSEKSKYDKMRYENYRKNLKINRENNPTKFRLSSYKSSDKKFGRECDLTNEFLISILFKPCYYCGHTDSPCNGLDRIDNSVGHKMNNVVTCCSLCNMTRGDRFTHQEFKEFIAPSIISFRSKCNG